MRAMMLEPNPGINVYVIMRVYRLGQRDMDIRYYVDPATMERKQELDIQAESYSVSEEL